MLIHNSKEAVLTEREYTVTPARPGKPNGLWYGINTSWHDWCEYEMPEFIGEYNHRILLDYTNILRISSSAELVAFDQRYENKNLASSMFDINKIDWERVRDDYSGIEISPYQWGHRMGMMWFYGWDVASGCIWDWNAIISIEVAPMDKLIAELDDLELDKDGNF